MPSFRLFPRVSSPAFARLLLMGLSLAVPGLARAQPEPPGRDEFSRLVQMAPFVVRGERLAVSIHARSGRDRRYAERFSEEVMKVIYEGVTTSTGKGLVIVGQAGEPHPIRFFRRFLAMAEAGQLDPAVAARGPELHAMLNHWQQSIGDGGKGGKKDGDGRSGGERDLEFEQIVTALPLPLEGLGAQLYQLAWAEKFDEAKVEARLRSLKAADLGGALFTRFDWVFYLPPRYAFDRVLDDIIAAEMKEDEAGFMARLAVKSVMLVVKPKIRRAIEALRKGVMLQTVVRARTQLARGDVDELMDAYVGVLMPDDDEPAAAGSEHERAVRVVRERWQRIEARTAAAGAGK